MGRKKKEDTPKLGVLDELQAKWGVNIVMTGGVDFRAVVDTIPTGSIGLDEALAIGGLPRGRVVEIYGPPSSGKTTLSLHCIANAQKQGLVVGFIDAEHALDPTYAARIGVDIDSLLLCQPDYGEQGLDVAYTMAASGEVGLIVIDSVAALTPKAIIDADIVDSDGKVQSHMGVQARMMSVNVARLTAAAAKTGCTVVFINQLRMKIGVMYGSPETTPGGEALKYYASVRLDVRNIGKLVAGEDRVGQMTRVRVVKNKLAPPFKETEFSIRFGEGIDGASELLDKAVELEILTCSGGRYKLGEKQVAHGREQAREWVLADGADILREALAKV